MNRYTNIRYHIYKELSKYRQLQEKRGADRINEFAVPILTGILVIVITSSLQNILEKKGILFYIFLIIAIPVIYILLLAILKRFFYLWENSVKPNLSPVKNVDEITFKSRQEEYAAKFNYEVTYLVEAAYVQVQNLTCQDNLLLRIGLLNISFCVRNILRKIRESLIEHSWKIGSGFVSDNMIVVVMEMTFEIIKRMQEYSNKNNNIYLDEISLLQEKYDRLKLQIEKVYDIDISLPS